MKAKLLTLIVLVSLSVLLISGCARLTSVEAASPFQGQDGWSASAPSVPGLNQGYARLAAAPAAEESAWPATPPQIPGYNAPYPQ